VVGIWRACGSPRDPDHCPSRDEFDEEPITKRDVDEIIAMNGFQVRATPIQVHRGGRRA